MPVFHILNEMPYQPWYVIPLVVIAIDILLVISAPQFCLSLQASFDSEIERHQSGQPSLLRSHFASLRSSHDDVMTCNYISHPLYALIYEKQAFTRIEQY